MIQFDEHIFQMGWFNHQLVNGLMDWWIGHWEPFFVGGACRGVLGVIRVNLLETDS